MLDSPLDMDGFVLRRLGPLGLAASSFLLLSLALASAARATNVLGPDDFELGFGSWTNAAGDDFDWTRQSGPTASGSTGPSGDHTSGSGFYLYTEASSPRVPGETAILESPCIDLSSATDANLDFWYHMFGAQMGSLDVEVDASTGGSCASPSGFVNVFSESGDLGDLWNEASVVLDAYVGGSIVIRFIGGIGSGITGDMAIDDVVVTTDTSAGPVADYVIVISFDGVNSDMLKSGVDADDGLSDEIEVKDVDDSGDYHNWKRLVDEGVYTWNARADYDATITTPNHTSIATGYPVGGNPGSADCDTIGAGGDTDDHCYTDNGEPQSSWTLHNHGNPALSYIPSMYDVAHDRGLSTAYFASKTKFTIFDRSYDATYGAPDTTGPDDGNDKIDRYYEANVNRHFNSSVDDALEMHLQFMWEMFGIDNFALHSDPDVTLSGTPAQRFHLTTLHYTDPDKAGHATGWPSPLYYETLRQSDDYIGEILSAIEADPILNGHTTLIVVTDHGGGNPFTHHNVVTDIINYKIPMFVWGAGAQANAEFYGLNATTRTDPGTGRPNFDIADPNGQPIRNSDSANLALSLLGLPPVPGGIVNDLQDLSIASAACGDGSLDAGEDCDNGASNGTAGQCCSATCSFESAATECRASAGACDVAEQCSGAGAACPADGFVSGGTLCRGSAGACDTIELCTGGGPVCPTDGFVGAGTECRASAGVCDLAEQCTGSDAACPADGFAGGGTECRASAGACDVAEQCTGSGASCPADGFVSGGTMCRAAAGACDVAEQCTGSGAACPADGFVAGGSECRAAAGVCDVAEQCTGSGAACPADGFVAGGTECRAAADVCDVAEQCTGSGASCPGDGFQSGGVECRASSDVCDAAEQCTGVGAACPADGFVSAGTECRASADLCDAAEQCTGTAAACPVDGLVSAGTECRAVSGACDLAEQCTGASPSCPSDGFLSAGVECRGVAGLCDVAEQCTGAGPSCPSDGFVAAFTLCRGSSGACDAIELCTGTLPSCPTDGFVIAGIECRAGAGACDVPEQCTGADPQCPANDFVSAGTECRAVSGVCDVAEQCTGAAAQCPGDGYVSAGTECRASAGMCDPAEQCTGAGAGCPSDGFLPAGSDCRAAAGACDVAEQCTGSTASCPADGFAPGTTPCDDAVACTEGETCDGAGACQAGTPNDGLCDDTLFCNGAETCDPLLDCQAGTPPPGDGVGCTDDVCDEVLDVVTSVPNDANCDDGLFCDGDEYCDALLDCQPGQAPELPADGVGCTDAVCDEVNNRIQQVPVNAYCQNSNLCDGSEWCHPITGCQPAFQALNCDDGDPCTADSCDAITGCANTPLLNCIVVPAASPGGRALLSLLVVGAGALLLSRRRVL